MKNIKLKKICMENFKGTASAEIEFSNKTVVKGANGVGKTTIYDALLWDLFDKNHSGASAVDIRPHDADGNDIHNIDIVVACTLEVDGREITLQKTQSEKWTKKRGTDVTSFSGNENTFTINGIPKSNAEYTSYIEENICDEKTFFLCTNAQAFFKLPTKEKRAVLLNLAKDVTDESVIATDCDFEPLRDMLVDGTVEQLIKRSKDTEKKLDKERAGIPPRIDELTKSYVDVDVAEYELLVRELTRQIEAVEQEITEVSADKTEIHAQIKEISDRADVIKDEYEKRNKERFAEYQERRSAYSASIGAYSTQLSFAESAVNKVQSHIDELKAELRDVRANIKEASDMGFDPDSLVCPTCGQHYPEERQVAIKEKFRISRGDRLVEGKLKEDEILRNIKKAEQELVEEQERLADRQKQLSDARAKLDEIDKTKPERLLATTDAEYINLGNKYRELKAKLDTDATETKQKVSELKDKKRSLEYQLRDASAKLSAPDRNDEIDDRIDELKNRQKEISQLIANEIQMVDLLERFNRTKMNMLSEEVNKHFKMISWELFRKQINGGYTDTCEAMVHGARYGSTLNTGHKILADIDLLTSFQKLKEIDGFLFVDNAEALNDFNIPEVDAQMVLLKVSEDRKLVVTND